MKKFILSAIAATLLFIPVSNAQNIESQSNRKKEIEEEIAQLDKQLSLTQSKQQSELKQLTLIKRQIDNRRNLIRELDKEIKRLESSISQKSGEVTNLVGEYNILKNRYSNLVYTSYKNRDKNIWFFYIFTSNSPEQGYRRWVYFREYAKALRVKARTIKGKENTIRKERAELNTTMEKSIKTQKTKQLEAKKLEQNQQRAQQLINQLASKEREFKKQIDTKKREVEKLNKEIERILAAAIKERGKDNSETIAANRALSDNFASNRGNLPWPVRRGTITEEFGQHNHPVFKNIKLPFNNGVDIATDQGADVFSVFNGVVKQILIMPGYNQCVLIQHGNYYTFYCKLDKLSVKSGQKISTGDKLGSLAIGSEGSALHFQIWNGTNKQNPKDWLSAR